MGKGGNFQGDEKNIGLFKRRKKKLFLEKNAFCMPQEVADSDSIWNNVACSDSIGNSSLNTE